MTRISFFFLIRIIRVYLWLIFLCIAFISMGR